MQAFVSNLRRFRNVDFFARKVGRFFLSLLLMELITIKCPPSARSLEIRRGFCMSLQNGRAS